MNRNVNCEKEISGIWESEFNQKREKVTWDMEKILKTNRDTSPRPLLKWLRPFFNAADIYLRFPINTERLHT